MIAANASGTPATILLRPGKRYMLTRKGAGENAALTGDLDISSGPLTVKTEGGGKSNQATIDANRIDRIFDGSLTLNGVTLRDGLVGGDASVGGAIRGGILDIRNSRLISNAANGHGIGSNDRGNGGAIFVNSGGELRIAGRVDLKRDALPLFEMKIAPPALVARLPLSRVANNESGSGGRAGHRRGWARRSQPLDHLRQQDGRFRFRWRHQPRRPAGGTDSDTPDRELDGRQQQRRL